MMISPLTRQQLSSILINDGKIAAIKFVKSELRCSLLEAKQVVESVKKGEAVVRADFSRSQQPIFESRVQGPTLLPSVASVLCFVVALFLFSGAWYVGHRNNELEARGEQVHGQVVGMASHGASKAPVFEYSWNDEICTLESSFSSNPPAYDVGDSADLIIDPQNPSTVLVNDFMHRRFAQVFMAAFGVVMFLPIVVIQVLFGGGR